MSEDAKNDCKQHELSYASLEAEKPLLIHSKEKGILREEIQRVFYNKAGKKGSEGKIECVILKETDLNQKKFIELLI